MSSLPSRPIDASARLRLLPAWVLAVGLGLTVALGAWSFQRESDQRVNGGKVSQLDVEEGLQADRPLIVLSGTGRLADEIASQPIKNHLIKVVPAHNRRLLAETLRAMLS